MRVQRDDDRMCGLISNVEFREIRAQDTLEARKKLDGKNAPVNSFVSLTLE
jgi:hypothetical protein